MTSKITRLKEELKKAVIGQEAMIEGLLIGLLSDGHILIEGVPGLAKTTTINALAKTLGLDFKRIQFTPDLLPSDIIGAQIYNPQDHTFSIKKGPLFTHLLLADEINRAPAKVQSALLEVMQERQVTIADETFALEKPFLVMATQRSNQELWGGREGTGDRRALPVTGRAGQDAHRPSAGDLHRPAGHCYQRA